MKIVCQKCSAAYSIDDKFITPKGVRAQCPKCKNLQMVKKEGGGSAAPAAAKPKASAPPKPAPVQAPPPPDEDAPAPIPPAPPSVAPLGASAPALKLPPAVAPKPAPAPHKAPSSFPSPVASAPAASSPFGDLAFDPLPPAGAGAPLGGGPPDPAPFSFDAFAPPSPGGGGFAGAPLAAPASIPNFSPPPPAAAPSFDGAFSFDAAPTAGAPGGPPAPAAGGGFSLDFADSPTRMDASPPGWDAAAGATQAVKSPVGAGPAPMSCKSCGKALTDPFDQALGICDDCRSNEKPAGAQSPSTSTSQPLARISLASMPAVQVTPPPEPEPVPEPEPAKPARKGTGMVIGGERSEGLGLKLGLAAAVVVVVMAGGAYLAFAKPWAKKEAAPLDQRMLASSSAPIDAVVEEWKKLFPDLGGSAAEYLAAGEEHLARDTPRGYKDAEDAFQKALILDSKSDRAIAGWVLALAFGRGQSMDEATAKIADQLLNAAALRGGDARVYAARAHFLITRKASLGEITGTADRAKLSPSSKDKALAEIALGVAYVGQNPKIAAEHFDEALKLDPKLKRGYIFQAELFRSRGDQKSAIAAMEKRLEFDPEQWEAGHALAKMYLEVGELALAKKTYERVRDADPTNLRPKIALGILAYQHEGRADVAVSLLNAVLEQNKQMPADLQMEALAHKGFALRLAGSLDAARKAADDALNLKADYAPAHLVRMLVGLQQSQLPEARVHFLALAGKLDNPGLESALEGRLLFAEGKYPEAISALTASVASDPRRLDAQLLMGAAGAKAKNTSKAWDDALGRGLKADPMYGGPLPVMTPNYVRPADIVSPAKGVFKKAAEDDPNPAMFDGLVDLAMGDWNAADAAFAQVLRFDQGNGYAYAYRALYALRKKDISGAARFASKAVDAERTVPLVQAAFGSVALAQNRLEPALKALRLAIDGNSNLQFAKVRMAEVQWRLKKYEEAKDTLGTVIRVDPSYYDAMKLLYAIKL